MEFRPLGRTGVQVSKLCLVEVVDRQGRLVPDAVTSTGLRSDELVLPVRR